MQIKWTENYRDWKAKVELSLISFDRKFFTNFVADERNPAKRSLHTERHF
jgi:hypothetical protein